MLSIARTKRVLRLLTSGKKVSRFNYGAEARALRSMGARYSGSDHVSRTKAKGGRGAFVAMRSYTKAGYPIEGRRRRK